MDWPGAVLHMEVSEVDSASLGWDNYTAETAEGLCQEKTRAHREGSRTVEEYTCGITQRGITTHGHLAQHKGWPWATHECWTWRLALRHAWLPRVREELQQGSPWGTELRSSKSARIQSVEGNGAASVIDTERCPSVTGHLRQVHGRTRALHGDYKISQTC